MTDVAAPGTFDPSGSNTKRKRDDMNSGSTTLKSLLSVNNLASYSLPPSLSVTVARSHKLSFATNEKFASNSNSTLQFVLTPGNDYIYGPDSYFTFKLTIEAGTDISTVTYNFGDSTVLNLFKEIRIKHAGGTELEVVQNLNVLNFMKWEHDRELCYRARHAGLMGYDAAATYVSNTASYTFAVPLSMLSEMFNQDKLLPSQLIAGMRIQLTLEDPRIAFKASSATAADTLSYCVENCRMHLDSHTLSDSVQKALARMSSNEGLDIVYPTYYADTISKWNSLRRGVSISKALSRVESIIVIPRLESQIDTANQADIKKSIESEQKMSIGKWQVAIGSQFFPSHQTASSLDDFWLAEQGRDTQNCAQYTEYTTKGRGHIRAMLERSSILTGSGLAISANRGATVNIERIGAAADRNLQLFVRHANLISVFLDNAVRRV